MLALGYAVAVFLATVLTLSAGAKLRYPVTQTGIGLLVGGRREAAAGRAVAGFEIVLAGWLVTGVAETFASCVALGFFLSSLTYLTWLRIRHPGTGCGCTGQLGVPVVRRVDMYRATFLIAAALGASIIGLASTSVTRHWSGLAGLAFGVAWMMTATRQVKPPRIERQMGGHPSCISALVEPSTDTLQRVFRSTAWSEHLYLNPRTDTVDAWREGCWRFFAFEAHEGILVAAVDLERMAVRMTFVDESDVSRANPASESHDAAPPLALT